MLSANSPNTKYVAIVCGLTTASLLLGMLSVGPRGWGVLTIGVLIAYAATFYFLGRVFTIEVVNYSGRRNLFGFLFVGGSVLLWLYARLVFGIDLTAPLIESRVLLAATVLGIVVGLADVGWQTGKLAESVAIERARGNV